MNFIASMHVCDWCMDFRVEKVQTINQAIAKTEFSFCYTNSVTNVYWSIYSPFAQVASRIFFYLFWTEDIQNVLIVMWLY
jgi:hypothetical protein